MTLTTAFTSTKVALGVSLSQVEGLLEAHGVREQRYTHFKPDDPESVEQDGIGRIVYEFVRAGTEATERRGVRITVAYTPTVIKINHRHIKRKANGTTAAMAGRALYWFLKAKFDAIDYGIEDFEVAFMPHLVTQIGSTFAETPQLIAEAVASPESIAQLALPAPVPA